MARKRSSRSRSAEIIGSNRDLMQEIFLFLPAKSLIRLQFVCRRWRSLISSKSFSLLHTLHHHRRLRQPQQSFLLRSKTSQLYMCHPTSKELIPFRFPFHCKFARFAYKSILQSCNGLLLLECWDTPRGKRSYSVYNPTTMKSREFSFYPGISISSPCLVFDPSVSPHYKVLYFLRHNPRVYDSETKSCKKWRQISAGNNKTYGGVYMNGGIYFVRSRALCYRFIFDDDFYEIGRVPRTRGGAKSYVTESNGHLHYVVLPRNSNERDFLRVFEMNQDDNIWFEKYRVDLDPISASIGESTRVVGVIRGEKEEDSMMLLHVLGKIMMYRFSDEIFEVLVDFRRESYYKEHGLHLGFTDSYPVIDTLAPV